MRTISWEVAPEWWAGEVRDEIHAIREPPDDLVVPGDAEDGDSAVSSGRC